MFLLIFNLLFLLYFIFYKKIKFIILIIIKKIWVTYSFISILLWPLSLVYGLFIKFRSFVFHHGIRSSWKAPIPVVIIGNLTIGGNGKTPVVIWLVEQLLLRGFRVGVVSRGYCSKAKIYPLLVDNNISVKESGDEPALIYQRTGIPIAISPKRVDAVKLLIKKYILDLIISDDGLQHYQLNRDYEIVVIDSIYQFGNGFLLPAGPLREHIYRLNTINTIIINGNNSISYDAIIMNLTGDIAINMLTKEKKPVNTLKNIVAIAGIGHPINFFFTLRFKGIELIATHSFPDHQSYTFSQLNKLVNKQQNLLMTEKDAIKCFHFSNKNWWYLPVNATFSDYDTNKIIYTIIKLIDANKQ